MLPPGPHHREGLFVGLRGPHGLDDVIGSAPGELLHLGHRVFHVVYIDYKVGPHSFREPEALFVFPITTIGAAPRCLATAAWRMPSLSPRMATLDPSFTSIALAEWMVQETGWMNALEELQRIGQPVHVAPRRLHVLRIIAVHVDAELGELGAVGA